MEQSRIIELANKLEKVYPSLSFKNHCYLRIVYDWICKDKWDNILEKPAYKNLTRHQEFLVKIRLIQYKYNKELLLEDNKQSLKYRNDKIK